VIGVTPRPEPGHGPPYTAGMAVNHEITSKEELSDGSIVVRCSCGDEIELFPQDESRGIPRITSAGAVTIESMIQHSNLYRQSEGER
jgi:hypothetical protein